MKNTALKTSGILFLLASVAQTIRFIKNVPVNAGAISIPVWVSAVGAVILFALACWMFRAAASND